MTAAQTLGAALDPVMLQPQVQSGRALAGASWLKWPWSRSNGSELPGLYRALPRSPHVTGEAEAQGN